MKIIMGAISGLFAIYASLREVSSAISLKKVKLSHLFFILYAIIYGWIPCLILWTGNEEIVTASKVDFSAENVKYFYIFLWIAILCYCFLRIGNAVLLVKKQPVLSVSCPKTKDLREYSILKTVGFISLAIGILCLILWINSYGGIKSYLQKSELLRNGQTQTSSLGFLKHFCRLSMLSTYIFVYLLRERRRYFGYFFCFFVSLAASLLFCFLNDGRMNTAMYIITVLCIGLGYFEEGSFRKKKIVQSFILLVIFIAIVLLSDKITYFIKTGKQLSSKTQNPLVSVVKELGFIYYGGQTSVFYRLSGKSRFFMADDIIGGLFAWVPQSLFRTEYTHLWFANTENIKNFLGIAGGTKPTGIVATSVYDGGVIGIIILPMFWGLLLKRLECMKKNPFSDTLYYSMVYPLLRIVMYCWLEDFLLSFFSIFVLIILYATIKNIKRVRR